MKQIVDKLNKIAKKIDESVEIPQTDLIIDSLDAITKAYGGTPNDSNLIVDKLEDIYNNVSPAVSGNIEITENGENINVAPYATATVNVSGGGGSGQYTVLATTTVTSEEDDGDYFLDLSNLITEVPGPCHLVITIDNNAYNFYPHITSSEIQYIDYDSQDVGFFQTYKQTTSEVVYMAFVTIADTEPTSHTISIVAMNDSTAMLTTIYDNIIVDKENGRFTIPYELEGSLEETVFVNCTYNDGILTLNKHYASIFLNIK